MTRKKTSKMYEIFWAKICKSFSNINFFSWWFSLLADVNICCPSPNEYNNTCDRFPWCLTSLINGKRLLQYRKILSINKYSTWRYSVMQKMWQVAVTIWSIHYLCYLCGISIMYILLDLCGNITHACQHCWSLLDIAWIMAIVGINHCNKFQIPE